MDKLTGILIILCFIVFGGCHYTDWRNRQCTSNDWPNGIVPYAFDNEINSAEKLRVQNTIQNMNTKLLPFVTFR